MLRKIIIVGAFFSFTLSIPCAVFAKDATSTGITRKEKIIERIDTMKEKMSTREAAMRAKLQNFRDKKKAQIAERVNTNLNQINMKQTEEMLKHLDKMSALLDKLAARVNSGSPDAKDPTASRAAIADSRSKIASAKAAVSDQAANDYTIVVTTERRIKADAQAQREKLHTDLKALRQQVIDAKQDVANAIRVAKGLGKEATESGRR